VLGCLSLWSVVCCHVEVSASDGSAIQRSRNECGVSECDREAWTTRKPRPIRGCCAMVKKLRHNRFLSHPFPIALR
jgi:hypothetical protein